jgi:CubicO group peptidase (beta-lactamase class C family)
MEVRGTEGSMRRLVALVTAALAVAFAPPSGSAPPRLDGRGSPGLADAQTFSPAEQREVGRIVRAALTKSGVPSASIAVVRGDRIIFVGAYGKAILNPPRSATTDTRYDIGSVSKQFTATLILMLADERRLGLDDKVSRYLPDLPEADSVTIRQLLAQTSGYPSYWVVSYVSPAMRRPVAPRVIAMGLANRPLGFAPGSRWEYSNTNYVVAGLLVEALEHRSLADVLRARIFAPLRMTSAGVAPNVPSRSADADGYTRVALGPIRPATGPASGWEFGAGGLSMTMSDLAAWDVAMLDHRLLSAAGYAAQQTPTRLADGSDTSYGLGLYVGRKGGHLILRHDGATSGFLTENRIYPDDGDAIAVAVNADFGSAQADIADGVQKMLLGELKDAPASGASAPQIVVDAGTTALAKQVLGDFERGRVERELFTANDLAYLTRQVRDDLRETLERLGPPTQVKLLRHEPWEGYDGSIHELSWKHRKLILVMLRTTDGRLDDFDLFSPD